MEEKNIIPKRKIPNAIHADAAPVSIQTYPLYSYVSHTVYQGSSPTCVIIMNPFAKIQKLKESHQNQCVKTNQLSEYHTGEVIICKKKFFFS